MNAAAPKLGEWVGMWQKSMPGFKPDSLFRVGVAPAFRGGYVQPMKNVYPPPAEKAGAFKVLSADSPDGRYRLIFDWYPYITEDAGEIEIESEPDSAPLLLDMRLGTSNQFESCGTPCGFAWGTWLSPTTFALAGWEGTDLNGQWKQGSLRIYSMGDSTSVTYVTRFVPAAGYDRYRDAWREWVALRFRALHQQGT